MSCTTPVCTFFQSTMVPTLVKIPINFFLNYDYDWSTYSDTTLLLLVNPHQNNGIMYLSYINYPLKGRRQLCSTHYRVVRINNCLKITSAIKVATMKITDNFCYKWKPSCAYHKINIFVVSKDEWDTKEGPGKFMKNTLHVQLYGKRHLSG